MVEYFFGEFNIAFGAAGARVVREDRFAETGSLGEADAAGYNRSKNLILEKLAKVRCDLPCQVGAVIEHGEENTRDFQGVVEGFLDAIDRVHEFGDSFEGEKLALYWYKDRVGGKQGIEGEKVEGWGAVDQDEVILVADFCDTVPETKLPVVGADQFQVRANQVFVGGYDLEAVEVGVDDGIADGCIAEDDVVEAGAFRIFGDAQTGSGIALGVRVDDEYLKVIGSKGCGQVDGGGRFSHPAFLVGYGENSAQGAMLARKRGPGVRGQGPAAWGPELGGRGVRGHGPAAWCVEGPADVRFT